MKHIPIFGCLSFINLSRCLSLSALAGNFLLEFTDIFYYFTGFYGTERTERSLIDYPVKDEDADDDAKFKEELSRWKRTDTGTGYRYSKKNKIGTMQ